MLNKLISLSNDKGLLSMYTSRVLSMFLNFTLFLFASKQLDVHEIYRLGILLTCVSLFQVLSEFGVGGSVIQDKHFRKSNWHSLLSLYYVLTIPIVIVGTQIVKLVYDFEYGMWFGIILAQFFLQPWINTYNTMNVKNLNLFRKYSIDLCAHITGFIISILTIKNFQRADFYLLYYLAFNVVVFTINLAVSPIIPRSFKSTFAKKHIDFGTKVTFSNSFEAIIDSFILYVLKIRFGVAVSGAFFQIKKFAMVPINLQILYINNEIYPRLAQSKRFNRNNFNFYEFRFVIFSFLGFFGILGILSILQIWTLSDGLNLSFLAPGLVLVLLEALWRVPLKLNRKAGTILKFVTISRFIGAIAFLSAVYVSESHYPVYLAYSFFYIISYFVFKYAKV